MLSKTTRLHISVTIKHSTIAAWLKSKHMIKQDRQQKKFVID